MLYKALYTLKIPLQVCDGEDLHLIIVLRSYNVHHMGPEQDFEAKKESNKTVEQNFFELSTTLVSQIQKPKDHQFKNQFSSIV